MIQILEELSQIIYTGVWQFMGCVRLCMQQQLSCEHRYGSIWGIVWQTVWILHVLVWGHTTIGSWSRDVTRCAKGYWDHSSVFEGSLGQIALVCRSGHKGQLHSWKSILLKVSPTNGWVIFGKRGKLSLRYVGPFELVEWVGEVAYKLLLALSPSLSTMHQVVHVSLPRMYVVNQSH